MNVKPYNAMESELRRIFGDSKLLYDTVYSGKMMIGKIDKDIRTKISFTDTHIKDHYNALHVTILNRTEGTVDSSVFKFVNIIGEKNGDYPFFWDEKGCTGWYGFHPTPTEYEKIFDIVHDYMSMFINESLQYDMHTM